MIIKDYVKQEKEKLRLAASDQGIRVKLGIIDGVDATDSANLVYMRNKEKDFEDMGWDCEIYPVCDMFAIPELLLYREIANPVQYAIDYAIKDGCTAIIVQLPLAEKYRGYSFEIPPEYDCDGFHPMSRVKPATPQGIMDFLKAIDFPIAGSNAVVVGRSNIVGRPMAKMLLDSDATVSVLHTKTSAEAAKDLLFNADLVICATGHKGTVKRNDCPHAFVVDVGINMTPEGKLCGDFTENEERKYQIDKPSGCTPVPGGVGLLTRLALLKNCFILAGGIYNA